jgi:putative ABC transport system permease protein
VIAAVVLRDVRLQPPLLHCRITAPRVASFESPRNRPSNTLPGLPAAIVRALLPYAERDEVLDDLAAEHAARAAAHGRLAAQRWLWRQLLGSIPALVRRSWWRGWTGFEPRASQLQSGGPAMESWIMDLRYSARRLASRPTYTLLAVLTLALGAAGTAAIFSIVRALLLAPLPIAHEEQVGVLWYSGSWTPQEFLMFRPNFPGFQKMGAYMSGDQTLELSGAPLSLVHGINTSAELFDVLGARPLLGRGFEAGDDRPNAAPVAMLSYGLWQELGGDATLIGRRLKLGGVERTVVGVMPRGFWFPTPTVRVWTAAPLRPDDDNGNWTLVGRITEGARIDHMDGPLAAIAAALGRRYKYPAGWDKTKAPSIVPVRDALIGDVRPALLATFGAMGVILLIACVNVAALMLGQVSGRSTELAVRSALGAGRQRLLQQLVLESLIIGVLAGAAGAALAASGFSVLLRSLPLGALADTAMLDWKVFAAALGVALLAASVIAVVPGIALWRGNLQGTMASTRTGGISGRGGTLDAVLVIGQIALAVLLAAGAGLLLRSVANLRGINAGIRIDGVGIIDVTLPDQLTDEQRHRVVLDMLPPLQTIPGVQVVAAAEKIPLRGSGDNWGMRIHGKPDLKGAVTAFRLVTDEYFKAMGIVVRRGRGFVPTDRISHERLVIINEALAGKYFPGEDPIGRYLETFDDRGERIIGVAANVAESNLTDALVPARYMLYEHVPNMLPAASFVLKGARSDDLPRLLSAGREIIHRDGHQLAVERTASMASVFDDAVGAPGRLATLLTLLAALALLLGAVGVYGMISHFVIRRMRDYAIRLALGLAPERLVWQVLGRGLRLVAAGSLVGIAAAIGLARFIASMLYGVQIGDPLALAGAVLTLLVAGALAALVPALRASRTDASLVLRQQ